MPGYSGISTTTECSTVLITIKQYFISKCPNKVCFNLPNVANIPSTILKVLPQYFPLYGFTAHFTHRSTQITLKSFLHNDKINFYPYIHLLQKSPFPYKAQCQLKCIQCYGVSSYLDIRLVYISYTYWYNIGNICLALV